jgi:predicted RNase H-like nuclease (RuvC/YqgF family)
MSSSGSHSRSSSYSNVSSRVDPTSVQAQFAALNRSRDVLRQQLQQIETERRSHEASISQLKQRCTALSTEHHVLHESLGKHRMRKTLLEKEKARLSTLFSNERQQLEMISHGIQEMVDESKQSKMNFCRQLQQISQSTEDLIQKHEDRHWIALLRDDNAVHILQKFAAASCNAGAGAAVGDAHPAAHSFRASHDWLDAIKKLREYTDLRTRMMIELSAFRDRAHQMEPVSY